jgi:N-acetylglucosamine-6-phosphate deacetylase
MIELTGRSVVAENGLCLFIEHDRVVEIKPADAPHDAPFICPGFIDLQVNGCAGCDYSAERFAPDHLQRIIRRLAASGTARHVPTIISSPQGRVVKNLQTLAQALDNSQADLSAAVAGIHIEGPFISGEDGPRGAHDRKFVRDPSLSEFEEWQAAAGGRIKIVTVAPEKKGALGFIAEVVRRGVVVAIGHTAASPQRIREAVAAGAAMSTHLGNGSHSRLPRLQNYLWEQLADDRLHAGIIADGFHLPAPVLKVFMRSKGLERLVLVSDIAAAGDQAPGRYTWGDIEVEVHADGRVSLAGTEFLAGAGHMLDRDIAQFMRHTGVGLSAAVALCTVNAARLLGENAYSQDREHGMPADLTLFRYRPGDERLRIEQTILRGKTLYRRI